MKIRPLGKRVLVEPKPLDEQEKTKSGILLPTGMQDLTFYVGKVLAIGDEVTTIKEGEQVAFLKYGYEKMKLDNDKELYVVDVASCIAVYEGA